MRMLITVRCPHEPFNSLVREGKAGELLGRITEESGAEAVYFTEIDGLRATVLVVDVADPSKVPSLAEPWFLNFEADVEFHVVMSPEDLQRAGLDELAERWG